MIEFVKAAAQPEKAVSILAQDIDRLGELRRQMELFKPVVAEEKKLTEKLLARADGWPAGKEAEDLGAAYIMRTSARGGKQRVTSYRKVYRWLGIKRFLDLASITFENLKKELSGEQYAEVVVKEQVGNRKLELVPRQAAA